MSEFTETLEVLNKCRCEKCNGTGNGDLKACKTCDGTGFNPDLYDGIAQMAKNTEEQT